MLRMDYVSLIIALAIAVYGFVEYRRRNLQHIEQLAEIRKGIRPVSAEPRIALWHVYTTGAVGILLFVAYVVLLVLEFRTGIKAGPYLLVAAFFAVLLVMVMLMFIRALMGYIRWRKQS
jgi:hypothetical protein